MPDEAWVKLRREARQLGIGPTALARMWTLERLRWHAISPQEMANKVFRFFLENEPARKLFPALTPRETEILEYIAQGYLNKQISEKLGVSETTIKSYLRTILRKLGVKREHSSYVECEPWRP